MHLIGMLDSPYVRRVAISFKLMGIPFTHESISVFRHYEKFAAINPVVKAPTLVTDEGIELMDSTLILDYAEQLVPPERRLTPLDPAKFAAAQRIVGLALAASDKAVQLICERTQRPMDKQHQPWVERVSRQLGAACALLEIEVAAPDQWLFGDRILQADVSTAVAWTFIQSVLPEDVLATRYPAMQVFAARAEALPEFKSTPLA